MNLIMMKIVRIATAILTVGTFAAAAHAAPAPQPTDTFVVADDGYLTVENYGGEQELPPHFCPPDAVKSGERTCVIVNTSAFGRDTVVAPVSAQKALDLAYGPNRTKLVGIAPQGWSSSVLYYRVLPVAAR